jgi:peptide/nickel transport system substrate-binding protein
MSGAALIRCVSAPAAPTAPAGAVSAPSVGPSPAPAATPQAAGPKYGGVFREIYFPDAPHSDPHLASSVGMNNHGQNLALSRLVKMEVSPARKGDERKPVGDLAESWEQTDDLTYIFKLRPSARWQNIPPVGGRDLVADDIIYSYNRIRNLGVFTSLLAGIEKIEAIDAKTLRFTLSQPDADFTASLTDVGLKIVAREAVAVNGDLKDGPVIGTGPWIFQTWDRGNVVTLQKNPDYFVKGVPYVERLEMYRGANEDTRAGAFKARQVNRAEILGATSLEGVKNVRPDVVFQRTRTIGSGLILSMQTQRPPFNDVRVRRAMAIGIDRQAILDSAWLGLGWQGANIQVPDPSWLIPEEEYKRLTRRDVEGAKRLLAEAGYPNGFAAEAVVNNLQDAVVSSAELAVAQGNEIGVRLTLKAVDGNTYANQVLARADFAVAFGGIFPSATTNGDLKSGYHSKGTRNASRLADPKLDDLIERQAVLVRDPEGRKKLMQEIQRYLLDVVPISWLIGYESLSANSPEVREYRTVPPVGDADTLTWVWLDT